MLVLLTSRCDIIHEKHAEQASLQVKSKKCERSRNHLEKQILQALQQINGKLDDQAKKLDKHSEILEEHSAILKYHGETLEEHGRILGALRSGQHAFKAELSELRLQNAKDFGELREQIKGIER